MPYSADEVSQNPQKLRTVTTVKKHSAKQSHWSEWNLLNTLNILQRWTFVYGKQSSVLPLKRFVCRWVTQPYHLLTVTFRQVRKLFVLCASKIWRLKIELSLSKSKALILQQFHMFTLPTVTCSPCRALGMERTCRQGLTQNPQSQEFWHTKLTSQRHFLCITTQAHEYYNKNV